jgi:hypothetical protein
MRASTKPLSAEQERQTASLIARLMSHYWASDTPTEIRREMAMDWLDDLREFGPDIVSAACGAWRRSQTKRPTPADVRRLCIEEQTERRMSVPAFPSPTAEQKERRDEARADAREADKRMQTARYEDARQDRENWARELGYQSFAQMMSIGLVNACRNAPAYCGGGSALTAADLGVTAKEFAPSPERLAADRRALGLEDDGEVEAP